MTNAAFSDYTENKIIDHNFRTNTWTRATTLYFALLTAAPTDAGGGTECSGTGYARVAKTPGVTDFTISGNVASNATAITFPAPGAAWGTATHIAIYDAASVGNLIAWDTLTASKVIGGADPAPTFGIGAFTFTYNSTSAAFANKVLTHIFGATAWAKPTALAFAFYTAAPTSAGGGTEVTGGSYARASVTPLDANFAAPSAGNGVTSNSNAINFPAPTGNWGGVLAAGIFDNTGLFCGFASFTAKNVNNGDNAPSIAGGNFTWSVG